MEINDLKNKFINDLRNDTYDNNFIVQKYLCNGTSPILDDEKVFEIKYNIAKQF